jgi:hypothetical protein
MDIRETLEQTNDLDEILGQALVHKDEINFVEFRFLEQAYFFLEIDALNGFNHLSVERWLVFELFVEFLDFLRNPIVFDTEFLFIIDHVSKVNFLVLIHFRHDFIKLTNSLRGDDWFSERKLGV